MNRAPSSHVLWLSRSDDVRLNPLSGAGVCLAADTHGTLLTKRTSPELAFISLFWSSPLLCSPASLPRWSCFRRSLGHAGSLRLWVPPTPADARSRGHPCDLAASRRPTGITSPGSARVVHLPALFHAGSSMGTRPSEVSPRSTPAVPPSNTITRMDALPPVLHAVSRLAAPRLRGFQPSCGRVLRRARYSRVRWVAPLLVVAPLRG